MLFRSTVACEMPDASEGLMSAIFQLSSWFQPNIFFRKPSTVASLGNEPLADVDEVAGGVLGLAAPAFWATEQRLAIDRPAVKTMRVKKFMVPFENSYEPRATRFPAPLAVMLNFRTIGALQQKTKPIDALQHKNEPYESLVSGHDFSRAERTDWNNGFSRCTKLAGAEALTPM